MDWVLGKIIAEHLSVTSRLLSLFFIEETVLFTELMVVMLMVLSDTGDKPSGTEGLLC